MRTHESSNEREPTVENLLKDVSFQRWAIGAAGKEERRRWARWIRRRASRREVAQEAARVIRLARFKSSDDSGIGNAEIDAAWERLQRARHHRSQRSAPREALPREEASRERWPAQPRRRRRVGDRVRVGVWSRRAAAALALALAVVGLWWAVGLPGWNSAPAETAIRTAYNERASLTLPGGTAITLNANSRLRLFVGGGGAPKREVYLDGEAFFDVARVGEGRGSRPFLVHTDDGTVRVLGTRFSVARRAGRTRVALNEGEVSVRALHSGPASESTASGETAESGSGVTLRPGQLAAFSSESEAIRVEEVNPEVYSSWTTGTLIFDETPVAVIAERIEHTYGLEVRAEDQGVLSETVSGQVENDPDVLVSGLSRLLDRPVQRANGAIIIQ